jgi:hypothetical protein
MHRPPSDALDSESTAVAFELTTDQNFLQEPIFKRFINPDDRKCQEKGWPPEFGIFARDWGRNPDG